MGWAVAAALTFTAGGCTVGPDYLHAPTAPVPATFKERPGWKSAVPLDLLDRGPWWDLYHDAYLSGLMDQVAISNQTVAAAAAAYDEARATIREGQAGLFPTVTDSYSATGSHSGSALTGTGHGSTSLTFNPVANATWDIDVWGRIRRTVESNAAAAQVSAADLQNAKLSEQAALATAYFDLRAEDAFKDLYDQTAVQYRRTLVITQNEYKAGTVSKADLVTAQTQLLAIEAQAIDVGVARAQYEHAIAVLIGRPPADLGIGDRRTLAKNVPAVPVAIPSMLLERRPDIAAAERTLQEENALIGVAVANFYPDISLSGAFGFAGATPLPIAAANEMWSIAGTATQTVFDGGLRSAELDAARASYTGAVATYRQTVLTAFQQVEDELAALRILAEEAKKNAETIKAGREAVEVYLNQYQSGTVAFTSVVTAEATLLSAEEAALTVQQNRLLASVALIEALGGGWNADQLPTLESLSKLSTLTPPL